MKLHAIRLLLAAVVATVAFSLSTDVPDAPDLPRDPGGYRFQFGVSLLAEDCADGTAEHQQCGSSFGIDPNLMGGGGGGGGGGGQQSEVCGLERTDCEGSNCKGEATMGYTTHRMACKVAGVTIRAWVTSPRANSPAFCCFR